MKSIYAWITAKQLRRTVVAQAEIMQIADRYNSVRCNRLLLQELVDSIRSNKIHLYALRSVAKDDPEAVDVKW
ncbi:MAG: hypothetical protein WAW80_03090 [Candidatus Saccharimonadales bacterium]